MNYGNETDSSHLFYIILVILCALIILNIVERTILQDIDTNKDGFNVLYYDTILHNIKLSKIVLCILLFTIFIILINPLKLLSIITPNIFSIIGKQYEYLTKYTDEDLIKILNNQSDLEYIFQKNHLELLNKTLKEIIMNTKNDKIILRILDDMGGNIEENKKILYNLIKSIELENELHDVDYLEFSKQINTINTSEQQEPNWLKLYNKMKKNDNNPVLDTSQYTKFTTFNEKR